jgi:Protein of unknown function (DUF3489)
MTRPHPETDQSEPGPTATATPSLPKQASPTERRPRRGDTPAASPEAVDASEPAPLAAAASPTSGRTKKAAVIALLTHPNGVSISDLMAATGWQAHSVRAALTGLRKEGHPITRDKDDKGKTCYRLGGEV